MEFSYYIVETDDIKCNFSFIKNIESLDNLNDNETIIYIQIEDNYKYFNIYNLYKVTISLNLLKNYIFYYIIYKLSLLINKKILNIFNPISYNMDFIHNIDILKKRQNLYSYRFKNIENIWLNEEINHITNILDKIEIDIDKYSIYILSFPYIKEKILYKQDIIDCICKYL
jgi:RNA recognition motif-containing protein